MQIEHDVHPRPDELPHECGDSMRDSGQRGRLARTLDERPIQIHAVIQRALARAGMERRHVEHRNQDDPAQHIGRIDLVQQPLDGHGTFVLVAVVGAKGDQPTARLNFTADQLRLRTYRTFQLLGRLKAGVTAQQAMAELGIDLVGGCCGSTPAHIAAMGAALFPA